MKDDKGLGRVHLGRGLGCGRPSAQRLALDNVDGTASEAEVQRAEVCKAEDNSDLAGLVCPEPVFKATSGIFRTQGSGTALCGNRKRVLACED